MGWLLILPLAMLLMWMPRGRQDGPRRTVVGIALLLGGIAESLYWLIGFTVVGVTAAWALLSLGGAQDDWWYLIPLSLGAIPFILSGLPLMVSGIGDSICDRHIVAIATHACHRTARCGRGHHPEYRRRLPRRRCTRSGESRSAPDISTGVRR